MKPVFVTEPPDKPSRPLRAAEFEREVRNCILESAGRAEKRGHVWLRSLKLAYCGWERAAIRAFKEEAFARLGIG